jgi:mono/diheme cytochrome c family protein
MNDEPNISTPPSGNESPATGSTVPMWIFSLTLVLLFVGGVYFDRHGGWFDAQVYAPYKSADELEAYQPIAGAAAKRLQGKVIYEKNCGICHGVDGLGKPNQFPPLAGSEWVNAKGDKRLAHIPLEGLNGQIDIKGQPMAFPAGMVAIGQAMSDADLAAVLTYIRSSWGNSASEVTDDDVKAARTDAAGKPPINGEQGLTTLKE